MSRIKLAGEIINTADIKSVLDVGCRDNSLKGVLRNTIEYYGNDIVQNKEGGVNFVGDFLHFEFKQLLFDAVVGLDVLEHTDDPYSFLNKMNSVASKMIIINLPNIYNIKKRFSFMFRGTLGNKYRFNVDNSLDRHRWVMGRNEIIEFYKHQAKILNVDLKIVEVSFGSQDNGISGVFKKILSFVFSKNLMVSSVFGVFIKKGELK